MSAIVFSLIILYNIDKWMFYHAAWSVGGVSITKLHGYSDGPGFDVTSIDLDVHGKGPMSFSCYMAREFYTAKEVKLRRIGPYDMSDIADLLLANGMLSEYQKRMLGHFPERPLGPVNIAVGGECSGLSSTPINSIGDAINQYDEILLNIEAMFGTEKNRKSSLGNGPQSD